MLGWSNHLPGKDVVKVNSWMFLAEVEHPKRFYVVQLSNSAEAFRQTESCPVLNSKRYTSSSVVTI